MKRYIISLLVILCFMPFAQAQKKSWGQVYMALEQNVMFPKWFDNSEVNRMTPNMSIPYIMTGVEVRIVKEFGIFHNIGFGIRKYHKGFADDYNVFDKISLKEYYIEDRQNKRNQIINGKMNIGLFYRFFKRNWTLTPQVGYGITEVNYSRLTYTLKKIESNEKYIVNYGVNKGKKVEKDGFDNFVMLKLKTERKLSDRFSLNLTAEYDYHIQKPKYTAEYVNYYNGMVVESKSIKGNRMQGLTLGVGIGFR